MKTRRRKARRLALQILYEMDCSGHAMESTFAYLSGDIDLENRSFVDIGKSGSCALLSTGANPEESIRAGRHHRAWCCLRRRRHWRPVRCY